MKRCAQCQSIFDDDNSFCLNDGTVLVAEPPPTVAYKIPPPVSRENAPFVVDLYPKPEIPTQFTPIPPVNQPARTQVSSTNYAVPLIIGLVLGGVVVIALFFIIKGWDEKEVAVSKNSNSSKKDNSVGSGNTNSKDSAVNSEKIDNSNDSTEVVVNRPVENTNTKKNDRYNGRVIMINAYLRSAPSVYADELDVLPLNSRIIIIKRAGVNSPWYRVTSDGGLRGWMHGDTIEYTR